MDVNHPPTNTSLAGQFAMKCIYLHTCLYIYIHIIIICYYLYVIISSLEKKSITGLFSLRFIWVSSTQPDAGGTGVVASVTNAMASAGVLIRRHRKVGQVGFCEHISANS